MKWQLLLLVFILETFSLNAVSSEDVPQVVIKGFKFIPQEITIKRGQTLSWQNREKRQYHSVWFETLGEEESDYIFPDESYEREFNMIGSFPYRCGPHPKMIGTVHVID